MCCFEITLSARCCCCEWRLVQRWALPSRSFHWNHKIKMHTNMSLPLIYNHWRTHLDLITKKHRQCDMLNNIYHLSISTHKLSAELRTSLSWRICTRLYYFWCIDVTALKTFLYEFHVNKLNSMYYSNWFVMSHAIFGLFHQVQCKMHTSDTGHF